jgi:hypothetical protein
MVMDWAQQRQEWRELRTPAEGEDDAEANHHFNYVARLMGSSNEQGDLSASLVTRAKDGALGCAEATCKIDGECLSYFYQHSRDTYLTLLDSRLLSSYLVILRVPHALRRRDLYSPHYLFFNRQYHITCGEYG